MSPTFSDRIFAARAAIAGVIAPPSIRRALEKHLDIELALLQLRMIIGDDHEALGRSLAAAFHHYATTNVTIAEALTAERRYVTGHGPRWTR